MMAGGLHAFDNEMSNAESELVNQFQIEISDMIRTIADDLPKHRNYSLAMTKLEEARLWLHDRANKPSGL